MQMQRPSGGDMNIGTIDEALETYVNERLAKGKEKASERFLAYVYLKHGSDEILDFLLKVGGLARCYIYCLKIAENPLKGQELGWFAAMAAVGVYGSIMMAADESRVLGIVLLAGALVHAWSLLSMMVKKWRSIGVRISLYKEIVQIVEKELYR
jgi:hypothetical protein